MVSMKSLFILSLLAMVVLVSTKVSARVLLSNDGDNLNANPNCFIPGFPCTPGAPGLPGKGCLPSAVPGVCIPCIIGIPGIPCNPPTPGVVPGVPGAPAPVGGGGH